jgi:DNA ligase 1
VKDLFKPLLADEADLDNVDFTNTWASAKLDGIRALVRNGVVISRNKKEIPNKRVQQRFRHLEHFDGELGAGDPTAKDFYRKTYSAVMSEDADVDVKFYVFDHIEHPDEEYHKRYIRLFTGVTTAGLVIVDQHVVASLQDILTIEQRHLEQGYEGLMLRAAAGPNSRYKFGRSTTKEGTLLKLKRFTDSEAKIIGMDEEMKNNNVATLDALGHTERSSHKANLVGKGSMGALVCKTDEGVEFRIGTGFTAKQRAEMWANQHKYMGKLAKFKHFPIGQKDAPRFPVFLGLRSEIDT